MKTIVICYAFMLVLTFSCQLACFAAYAKAKR